MKKKLIYNFNMDFKLLIFFLAVFVFLFVVSNSALTLFDGATQTVWGGIQSTYDVLN